MTKLTLYGSRTCSYSAQVEAAIRGLGTDVARIDVNEDPDARQTLRQATGRGTIPVLRVDDDQGETRWIPESLAIIRYLRETAGSPDPMPRWLDTVLGLSPAWASPVLLAGFAAPAPAGPVLQVLAVSWFVAVIVRRAWVIRSVSRFQPSDPPADDPPR